uniref:Uncharacterized protein n=1 Tax=Meloidogyne enterolobii TaxID=390850 RepID=A0A6V7XM90_MELEN|nr:unnamed protein product [Meloidogyne enterolobii]
MGKVEDESIEKETKETWNVDELRKGLEEIVTLREEVQRCAQTFSKSVNYSQQRFGNNWSNNRGFNQKQVNFRKENFDRVFAVQSGDGNAKNSKKFEIFCYFCHGNHHAEKCEIIKAIYLRTKILSEQNRCLLCLRKGHTLENCESRINCNICRERHNKLICPKLYKNGENKKDFRKGEQVNHLETSEKLLTIVEEPKEFEKEKKGQIKKDESVNQINKNIQNNEDNAEGNVILMKADLMLKERNNKINVKCFFDSGATVNFLCNEIVEKLKLKKLKKTELGVVPFFRKEPIKLKTSCYSLKVLLDNGNFEEIIVYSINKNMMPRFKCADLRTNEIVCANIVPDMLIGMKHFWRFFKRIKPLSDYLFKVETIVGPIICGEISGEKFRKLNKKENLCTILSSNTLENEELNNYWSLETIGVKDDPVCKDDKIALDLFNNSIKRKENGSYVVKWPWKIERDSLPSNFSLAYKRFLNLMDKLKKNPDLLDKYEEIINNDLERGVIEKAERKKDEIEHFLPHHPVNNTKKVRIVYDTSAKMREGKSLNEYLLRGPIIMPDIAGILIRFRVPKIAMWADIEKAFHTLELEKDREVTKFIWICKSSLWGNLESIFAISDCQTSLREV